MGVTSTSGVSEGFDPKDNFHAGVAPTINDGANKGYSIGSTWVDAIHDAVYICADATVGSAVWLVATEGVDLTSPLTTKGDLWGFSNVDIRIPVGTDGTVLVADSTSATGISYKVPQPITTITAGTTSLTTQYTVLCDAVSGNIILNLGAAASYINKRYEIKKIDSSNNIVTIVPNGAEKIDGEASLVINTKNSSYTIVCDGANWYII